MPADALSLFLPAVRQWFESVLGKPTPAQERGWPEIAAGRHTLMLAPTGSGKTLAAFLACLDTLWRRDPLPRGVQVLYVSPLKALNNDIYRNLQLPLTGVAEFARQNGVSLPEIEVAVRTGDTPGAERQRLLRRPPHVLITTPESLHLLLTSRARETLRGVTHCIVDEIHALCPNKRGVFLALLLERLAALNPHGFVRIGLSATQRPLDEVGRYLGGWERREDGRFVPRPVAIVDAGFRKDLDLRVVSPVADFGPLPEKSIWPSIYRLLDQEIRAHRSTIVFANNRRSVERITAQLNAADIEESHKPLARAHHGSVALEVRQDTEQALKEGRLPAVVATASLELGIDMGAVDLVCQVESPGSVARGLQRVGRAGHLVGGRSKGRLIPKTANDLLEQAVLAREMAAGRVEEIRVPRNCLDVLAQQIVAMVAVETWDVPALHALVRQAYPFRDLSPQALDAVLEMISGRFRLAAGEASGSRLTALQPRVSWDRIHNRLRALPGSQHMALVNGGTIPDMGHYAVYTGNHIRLGELDEEFVYERRIGDTFLLGTNAWRVESIEADRVLVSPAEGAPAMAPFWHGEQGGRSYDLGVALGGFLRELKERLDHADTLAWLERDYYLNAAAARNLRRHVRQQLARACCLPTDRTLVVEASRDQLGDWQVIFLSPYGSRLHLALRLALEAVLRQRLGYTPQCLHHNEGILIRMTDTDEPILDIFEGLTPENVKSLILDALAGSALFALRFRQNAARALLLPRGSPGKRAPLWLQRLRGRDLLQVARRQPNFPIVAETFRECLHDHLDLPRLEQLLADIREKRIEIQTRRLASPSPFAAGLLFAFNMSYMYQYDDVEPDHARHAALQKDLLDQLVAPDGHAHLLDPRAVQQVERRLRGLGQPPRSATEMAEWLRRLGDVAPSELEGPMAVYLEELEADGRAKRLTLSSGRGQERWILTEEQVNYRQAFGLTPAEPHQRQAAAETILSRFLDTHALVGLGDVLERYPFERGWTRRQIETWAQSGRLVAVRRDTDTEAPQWSAPANLEQVQRGSLALLRSEILTCPAPQFADFVARWQGLHPETRQGNVDGLAGALTRLEGLLLPAALWGQAFLPARVPEFQPRWLDELVGLGSWTWVCQGDGNDSSALAFLPRASLAERPLPQTPDALVLSDPAEQVLNCLRARGALFIAEIAEHTSLSPGAARIGLRELMQRGLVTNDRLDAIRCLAQGGDEHPPSETQRYGGVDRAARPLLASRSSARLVSRRLAHLARGTIGARSPLEGRWSLVPWGQPDVEAHAVHMAQVLLQRYGVAARELAVMDPWMPPWRILYEVFSRMELAGEIRRGYFVEGLSGAQFALPEAARLLQDAGLPSQAAAPTLLLHSLDPANLYGAGAAFDIPLLDGGTRALLRRPGNWLVLRAGRPILLIEQHSKRLTCLPSASADDRTAALAHLPGILGSRHKLTVERWNNRPVTETEGRELLEAAGFVPDYRSMTLYAAWRNT
jgi:ATP-dependent helicase Lhr and Lhr-like helicase